MLQDILTPGRRLAESSATVSGGGRPRRRQRGPRSFLSDAAAGAIYRLDGVHPPVAFAAHAPVIAGEAFGPDGHALRRRSRARKRSSRMDAQGTARTVAEGIAGHGILVTHDGHALCQRTGRAQRHAQPPLADQPGRCEKKSWMRASPPPPGSPSRLTAHFFFAAENSTQWIYSYALQPDGTFDRQATLLLAAHDRHAQRQQRGRHGRGHAGLSLCRHAHGRADLRPQRPRARDSAACPRRADRSAASVSAGTISTSST